MDAFRGVKGVEDEVAGLTGNAAAGVGHGNENAGCPGRRVAGGAGPHGQASAGGTHAVNRVADQVVEDLANVALVAGELDVLGIGPFYADVEVVEAGAIEQQHFFQQGLGVHQHGPGGLPVKAECLGGDLGDAGQLAIRRFQIVAGLLGKITIKPDQVEQVGHGFERVVDFVRDGGGKLPDGGELLRLQQHALGAFLLAEIDGEDGDVATAKRGVGWQNECADEQGDGIAVLVEVGLLVGLGGASAAQLLERTAVEVGIAARRQLVPAHLAAGDLLLGVAQHGFERGIHIGELAGLLANGDAHAGRVNQGAEAAFALLQGAAGAHVFRGVLREVQQAYDFGAAVADGAVGKGEEAKLEARLLAEQLQRKIAVAVGLTLPHDGLKLFADVGPYLGPYLAGGAAESVGMFVLQDGDEGVVIEEQEILAPEDLHRGGHGQDGVEGGDQAGLPGADGAEKGVRPVLGADHFRHLAIANDDLLEQMGVVRGRMFGKHRCCQSLPLCARKISPRQ